MIALIRDCSAYNRCREMERRDKELEEAYAQEQMLAAQAMTAVSADGRPEGCSRLTGVF